MFRTSPDRVIQSNEAPTRLAEILRGAVGDKVWLIAEGDTPKVAIIDAQFFDRLLRRAWFDELASRTQGAFHDYLIRQGLDPDKMSEEEVEAFLQR
jgi:hypothetical protein